MSQCKPHTMKDDLKAVLALSITLHWASPAIAEELAVAPAAAPVTATGEQPAPAVATESSPAEAEKPGALNEQITQNLLESVKWLELEHERNKYIVDAIKAADADGVRRQYQAQEPVEITRRSIVLDGLQRNLTVQRGALAVNIAQSVLDEAHAVFEPVFNVSLTHSDSRNYNRVENLTKFKRGTTLITDQKGNPHNAVVFEEGLVDYLGFDKPRPAGIFPTTEIASESNIFGADTQRVFNLAMQQALPWGADLVVSYQMKFHDRFFVNNAGARRAGLATFGDYGRPWSGALAATLSLPLPYTRNFGANSVREVIIKLTTIGLDRAQDNARALVNQTLRDVDVAYFNLVRRVLVLDVTLTNQHQIEELVKRTKQLLKMELITQLGESEVETEQARVSGEVELAWADYVVASNNLNQLTNQDPRRLLLPVGYAANINGKIAFEQADEALKDASHNPTYLARSKDLDAAQLIALQHETDARPDVRVDATSSYVQLDQSFGYSALDESLGSTFDPDFRQYNTGISYQRPWGNRAPRAALRSANLEVSAQTTLLKQDLNTLNRGLDDALVDHASARARVDITARNLELQRAAYDKALAGQSGRTVTEFELIAQSGELLRVHLKWIEALIAAKQAEIAVLAAAGVLPDRYAELTALSMLDQNRLVSLTERHKMRYFGGDAR